MKFTMFTNTVAALDAQMLHPSCSEHNRYIYGPIDFCLILVLPQIFTNMYTVAIFHGQYTLEYLGI